MTRNLLFGNCFILVGFTIDTNPIPGTLSARQEYTLERMDGMPVHHRVTLIPKIPCRRQQYSLSRMDGRSIIGPHSYTPMSIKIASPPCHVFGRQEETARTQRKPKLIWGEHLKHQIDSNPSSGSNPRQQHYPLWHSAIHLLTFLYNILKAEPSLSHEGYQSGRPYFCQDT